LALVKMGGPAQVASLGPKTVNVTVPVGAGALGAPVTEATSVMEPPRGTVGVAWVTTVGGTWVTTEVSLASLQAVVTGR
jgi:hypothetical protein